MKSSFNKKVFLRYVMCFLGAFTYLLVPPPIPLPSTFPFDVVEVNDLLICNWWAELVR